MAKNKPLPGEPPSEDSSNFAKYRDTVLGILQSVDDPRVQIAARLAEGMDVKELAKEFNLRVSGVLSRVSRDEDQTKAQKATEAFRRYTCERLIFWLKEKGWARQEGNVLTILPHRLQKVELRRSFRSQIIAFGKPLLGEQPKGVDIFAEIFSVLGSYVKVTDEKGQPFVVRDFIERRSSAGVDSVPHIESLSSAKTSRLWLKYPEEEISESEALEREDDRDGFLCIFDEERQCYRKIRSEKEVSPGVALRRSDLEGFQMIPRQLGAKNVTPLIDGVKYYFPQSEFAIPGSGEKIKIDPQRDTFLKLSNEFGALIINRGRLVTPFLFRFASKLELIDQAGHRESIDRTWQTFLRTEESVARLQAWDVTQFIPPRANELPQAYAKRVMKCGDINNFIGIYRELLDEADFKLQQFDLKKQLLFASYYANLDDQGKEKIGALLQRYGRDFFEVFEACEFGLGMGDIIVQIAENHGEAAVPIFRQFREIMEIFKQKEVVIARLVKAPESVGDHFDETKFYSAIAQRGVDLLHVVAAKKTGDDLGKFLEEAKQYHTDVIAHGALLASLMTVSKKTPVSPGRINEILSSFQVETPIGQDLIKQTDRRSMEKPENYKKPDIFNEKDYAMVVKNLRQAYSKIDPGWLEYLIDNIPRDLTNPKVKFVLVKNKANGELVGLCKIKPDTEEAGAYYFGTHYVNQEFQKGFGVGEYVQKIAESLIPAGAKIVATVAPANPAMERHIDVHQGAGVEIVREGDDQHHSKELVKFVWNNGQTFSSKDRKKFPPEVVKRLARKISEGGGLPKTADLYAYQTDLSGRDNQQFITMAKEYFAAGYALTRVFYDRKGNQPDLTKAYIVFERSQTKSKTSSKSSGEAIGLVA